MSNHRRFDYLTILRDGDLTLNKQILPREPIAGFYTMAPEYDFRIRGAMRDIRKYFDDPLDKRPLSVLVLGPPGAGKSFLAEKLKEASGVGDGAFFTINCSRFGSPKDLSAELQKLTIGRDENKLAFIDEFDVTLAGSSVIRYLIDPVYEGKDADGREFKKTVFVFCGSYLRDLKTLHELEGRGAAIDLPGFLRDLMLRATPDHRKALMDGFLSASLFAESQARATPEQNVVRYLRRLEKLTDFLSRINGPVIEIPDVAKPLEIARPFFLLTGDGTVPRAALESVELSDYYTPQQLVSFVERAELSPALPGEVYNISSQQKKFSFVFDEPWEPVLALKNMVVLERLLRVCNIISRRKLRSQKRFRIRAADLNYLAVVPVVHGMRSLETIIMKLLVVIDGDVSLRMMKVDPVVESQIVDESSYKDPLRVWNALMTANDRKDLIPDKWILVTP